MTSEMNMAGLALRVPADWAETTAEQPTKTPTLAKRNGIGALQFTVARYLAGPRPHISAADAADLLRSFLHRAGIDGPTVALAVSPNDLKVAQANVARPDEYVRAWCLTDGESSVIATYISLKPWDPGFRAEFLESGQIVASIRFPSVSL